VAHYGILIKKTCTALHGLVLTIVFSLIFTGVQIYEYTTVPFSINDSIFGSLFFILTGFHGLHVIIGTIFLIIGFINSNIGTPRMSSALSLECSIIY
jgi:cytochrome c oxidase subunit 3